MGLYMYVYGREYVCIYVYVYAWVSGELYTTLNIFGMFYFEKLDVKTGMFFRRKICSLNCLFLVES